MDIKIKNSKFYEFYSHILSLPLWIKEVIYIYLKKNLLKEISETYLNVLNEENDIFLIYHPKLTYKGKHELETREKRFSESIYKLLKEVESGYSIIDIVINNYWNLEEASRYFVECIEDQLIAIPPSLRVLGTAQYLSGKIRLGEYFTRIERITLTELDIALREQTHILEATGDKIGIAGLLVNKGLVTEQDVQGILKIKEESKKRFILNLKMNIFESQEENTDSEVTNIKEQNNKLLQENKILKEQLRKILNISK